MKTSNELEQARALNAAWGQYGPSVEAIAQALSAAVASERERMLAVLVSEECVDHAAAVGLGGGTPIIGRDRIAAHLALTAAACLLRGPTAPVDPRTDGYKAGLARAVTMLRERAKAIRMVEHAEHPGNAPCQDCSTAAKKSNALEAAADEIGASQ